MNWPNWIWSELQAWWPAISTSTLTRCLLTALGFYYKERIKSRFSEDLEILKAELHQSEEEFRAELAAKETEISSIRNSLLTSMSQRHSELDKRKLQAIEAVWRHVTDLAGLKVLANFTQKLDMERSMEMAQGNGQKAMKVRQFAEVLWTSCKIDELSSKLSPQVERLFLSPMAWAVYSAYKSALSYAQAQFAVIRTGVGPSILADPSTIIGIVKTALPSHADFIDQFGVKSLPFLLDTLEERLVSELISSLEPASYDHRRIQEAAEILKAANALSAQLRSDIASVPQEVSS